MRSYTNLRGAFRATGASLPFLSRRAHLLTTCEAGGGIPSDGQFVKSGQEMPQVSIPCAVGASADAEIAACRTNPADTLPASCLRKPATGSFIADMGSNAAHFLFAKRNRNQGVAFYHPLTKYESR